MHCALSEWPWFDFNRNPLNRQVVLGGNRQSSNPNPQLYQESGGGSDDRSAAGSSTSGSSLTPSVV